MDRLLKRHFWLVWLLFLAVAAWLVARTGNVYVRTALEPAADLGAGAPAPRAAPAMAAPAVVIDPAKLGHFFGINPPPPPAIAENAPLEVAPPTSICWTCEPVKTNLRLQLLATMIANEKRWSMALILDLDRQTSDYYFQKDHIKNATVHSIQREPQRVIIVNDDTHRLEYIDSVPGTGAANANGLGNLGTAAVPPPDAPPAEGASSDNAPIDGVKQRGENDYSVTRSRLDSTLSNLNDVATQARIVPSFKNGVANGFKLFSIRPNSIYSALGIQNGDVISRINGFEMNSPDKALEIYTRLKDAKNVEIEFERRGQVNKKKISID